MIWMIIPGTTALIGTQQYPLDKFNDPYRYRRPVEDDYTAIKCRMEPENYSRKSALSVYWYLDGYPGRSGDCSPNPIACLR
jgi:hypothetical protein